MSTTPNPAANIVDAMNREAQNLAMRNVIESLSQRLERLEKAFEEREQPKQTTAFETRKEGKK